MTSSYRQIAQAKSLRKYPSVYVRPSENTSDKQSQLLPYILQVSRKSLLLTQLRTQRLHRETLGCILEGLVGYLDLLDIGWQTLDLTRLDEESCRIATICRDPQKRESAGAQLVQLHCSRIVGGSYGGFTESSRNI